MKGCEGSKRSRVSWRYILWLAATVSLACDITPKRAGPKLPDPLGKPLRRHVGPTSQRWTGPCWRDFAAPDVIGASSSYSYDSKGFVSSVAHVARSGPKRWKQETRNFQRHADGRVTESVKRKNGSYEATYSFKDRKDDAWVAARGPAKPVGLTPRTDKPLLCLCPTNDQSLCFVGERIICLLDVGAPINKRPGAASCIACGERVEMVSTRTYKKAKPTRRRRLLTATPRGIEEGNSGRPLVELDVAGGIFTDLSRGTPSRKKLGEATTRKHCSATSRHDCKFDAHGNLLELHHLDKNGAVKQRTVFSYACHEERAGR